MFDTNKKLVELFRDRDPAVQRIACESMVGAGSKPKYEEVAPLSEARIDMWPTQQHGCWKLCRPTNTRPRC